MAIQRICLIPIWNEKVLPKPVRYHIVGNYEEWFIREYDGLGWYYIEELDAMQYYDGERCNIPEGYRMMTFQGDIPEKEVSEWAMDIAYDIDEFFRQHDPRHAAEHPEEHAAKEEIYDKQRTVNIFTVSFLHTESSRSFVRRRWFMHCF